MECLLSIQIRPATFSWNFHIGHWPAENSKSLNKLERL
jgi:hypothetical protein